MPATLPSTDDLIATVHHYYPAGTSPEAGNPAYFSSPEWLRFCDLWERVMRIEALPRWDEFRAALKKALPDCSFWDTTVPRSQACRRLRVYLCPPEAPPGQPEYTVVVGLVSILAPVYSLYESHYVRKSDGNYTEPRIRWLFSDQTAPYARVLAEHIEEYFGCCPLPPEVGRIRVPDVKSLGNVEFGQQTLFELLLTEDLQ
ncbi:MAG TPA: hypothetical protein VH877_10665 [Polyangia bacterium]|nr:hypothetical protein [Polyangia bacterium]